MVKRVAGRLKRGRRRTDSEEKGDLDPEIRARAAGAIREYADAQATLFERAERLRERAERLEGEGTPSDSALNRAERAESEVAAGLTDLRASFVTGSGEEGRLAFDKEIEILYPALKSSVISPQPS